MGGQPEQDPPLAERLPDQVEAALFEIAQPPVDETARSRAGPFPEVPRLDQGGRQAAQGRIPRDPGASDPAADNEQVKTAGAEVPERGANRRSHVLGVYSDSPDATELERPSSWFAWHAHRIQAGSRVLDLASGAGRHALAAAGLGGKVTAVDKDPLSLDQGRREAKTRGLEVTWIEADLEKTWPDLGTFDAVLMFNYLDRGRMPKVVDLVAPGGLLMAETFLEAQKAFGWGPSSDDHLLRTGELFKLVLPLVVVHGREVVEAVDSARWSAIASALAQRK